MIVRERIQERRGEHISHCPAICSICCGTKVAQIEKYEHNWKIREKKVEGEQLSIFSSIRNEIQEIWENTYMNVSTIQDCGFKEK
jgi:hypothetical protein